MDTLPLETLQRIFAFACTDGGPTGVALSLTSKVIRAASRTARFHSISLVATPRRFRAFVALYERECDASLGDKPHIRHLYLTYPDSLPKGSLQERRSRSLSPSPGWWQRRREFVFSLSWRVRFPKRGEEWSDEDNEDVEYIMDDSYDSPVAMFPREDRSNSPPPDPRTSPEYRAATQRLFQLVAPDLLSLAIDTGVNDADILCPSMLDKPFAVLRELTLVNVDDHISLFTGSPDASPLFPALTHLHILSQHMWRDLSFARWVDQAPRVTHLGLTCINERHVEELARAVGVVLQLPTTPLFMDVPGRLPTPTPPPSPAPRTYPSVQVLVMEPCPPPVGAPGFGYNPLTRHAEMLDELQQISDLCAARGDVRAIPHAHMDDVFARAYALDAYGDWLERLTGGDGFWVEEKS
ncbi:hypothetical protein C2E23DRAFT_235879, partial [Lenzites betulinus]